MDTEALSLPLKPESLPPKVVANWPWLGADRSSLVVRLVAWLAPPPIAPTHLSWFFNAPRIIRQYTQTSLLMFVSGLVVTGIVLWAGSGAQLHWLWKTALIFLLVVYNISPTIWWWRVSKQFQDWLDFVRVNNYASDEQVAYELKVRYQPGAREGRIHRSHGSDNWPDHQIGRGLVVV